MSSVETDALKEARRIFKVILDLSLSEGVTRHITLEDFEAAIRTIVRDEVG